MISMIEAKGLNPKDRSRSPVGCFPLYVPLIPDILRVPPDHIFIDDNCIYKYALAQKCLPQYGTFFFASDRLTSTTRINTLTN